ncbi:MAG TPA: alpha/beta hydrolase [Caulobacteraceae bacterium]|nr:alpha/beta hydrolase [Caulobacteraceae bacterium]
MRRPEMTRALWTARDLHRFGLERARAIGHYALTGRDPASQALAEAKDLSIELPGRTLRGRLYTPAEGPVRGLLLFFHGGGFVVGDIDSHDAMCRRLSAAGGFRTLSVAYRLAPEHLYPAQLHDAFDAAEWATRALGSGSLAIGGDSAGAYLAISTALARPGRFAAQLLIYPLLHLDEALWADSVFKDGRIVGRMAVRYIRAQLHAAEAHAPSLLDCDLAGLPPTVLVSGGALDPVRPDALAFAKKAQAAGVDCEVQEYALQLHGFLNLTHISPIARQACIDAGEALGRRLRS